MPRPWEWAAPSVSTPPAGARSGRRCRSRPGRRRAARGPGPGRGCRGGKSAFGSPRVGPDGAVRYRHGGRPRRARLRSGPDGVAPVARALARPAGPRPVAVRVLARDRERDGDAERRAVAGPALHVDTALLGEHEVADE